MSARRQVKLGNLDLDKLEDIARSRGRKVSRNTSVQLYRGTEDCDLVVDGIGFKRAEDGTIDAIYDDMHSETYAGIMADYIEETVEDYGNYHVVGRIKSGDFITITLRR